MQLIKRINVLAILLAFILTTPAVFAQRSSATKPAVPTFGNVDGITAKQLREYLTFIASDELEGRDTPSRGLDIAAMYIAQHLSSWGIKPAGDNGTYFQRFPIRRTRIDRNGTRLEVNGQAYTYGDDFLAGPVPGSVTGNLVYGGLGWYIKSKNFDSLKGLDVKDKIVVVYNTLPKGITFADLQGKEGEDWASPTLYAQMKGAKAVITIATYGSLTGWRASLWNQTEKGSLQFGKAGQSQITIPTITASPGFVSALFQGEKSNGIPVFNRATAGDPIEPFEFKTTKRVSLTVSVKTDEIFSQNVVGVLEGSDPVLKNEYVAIGAHYDHVGMNPFYPGDDKIWNGADDDGSGTVSVLSIAEAFAKGAQKPKRSILFIWHAGEEKGLWGSDYYTTNPTVPIGSIITQLNVDMIGRYQNPGDENHPQNKRLPKPHEVFTIGSKMMSTELGEISDSVNKSFLNLNYNLTYDGPDHPDQFFYRSDHFNYARKGIPIIFFMDGDHADYHQPSDSVEKINFEQMEKVARTIMATGWTLANRPTRPKVDKPLPASVTGN